MSGGWAAAGLILGLVVVLLLLSGRAIPLTCDPPRHLVTAQAIDGMGATRCVSAAPAPGGGR